MKIPDYKDPSVLPAFLKAGGARHNLTSASYVVRMIRGGTGCGKPRPIDRTHRIGQKNKVSPTAC